MASGLWSHDLSELSKDPAVPNYICGLFRQRLVRLGSVLIELESKDGWFCNVAVITICHRLRNANQGEVTWQEEVEPAEREVPHADR